jgi:hypothetical protein
MARALGLLLGVLAGVASASSVTGSRGGDLAVSTHGRESLLQAASISASRKQGKSFVKSLDFKHKLRVCNAYPYSAPVEVLRAKEKITTQPLRYKTCMEFDSPVRAGDKLQFNIGGSNAGSFKVSELPNADASLVLVIYRHDAVSTAVAFESHVFANLINAQIAVLDTYQGKAKTMPRIQDIRSAKTARNEELRYDSVVAVNPGLYEIVLQDDAGQIKARTDMVALNRESYVVIRAGVEAESGPLYPQELMVYPKSDPKELTGAASSARFSGLVASVLALALVMA